MVGWYDPRVLAHSGLPGGHRQHFRPPLGYAAHRSARQPAAERVRLFGRAGRLLVRLRGGHRRRLEFHVRHRGCHRASRARARARWQRERPKRPRAGLRWRRGLSLPDAYRIRRAHRNALQAGVRRPRAPRRVRDSRQPRLVRQPGGVLAHLLPARARLCRLPHAADAQLLRAQTTRQLVAAGHRPAARRRSRRAAGAVLPEGRLAHGRCRAPDLLRAGAALDSRGRLSAPLELRRADEHALPRRESLQAQGARVPHRRPALLQAARKRRRHPEDHLGRRRRVPASHACAGDADNCATASCERAVYPDEKTSRRLCVAEFSVPVHQSEVRLAVRVPLRHVGVAGVGEPRGVGRHRSADRARRHDERGDPRSAEWHVAGQHHRRVHLLHRHARPLVAHPGRRLSRAAASGGGVPVGWLALAAHGAAASISPTAALRNCCCPASSRSWWAGRWAPSSSASIYSSRSASSGATATKRSRRCASRISSSGCGCASTRPAVSRSMRSPSTGFRGAGATAQRNGEVDDRSGRRARNRTAAHRQG